VRVGDLLYVIADDEHHLGVFPASGRAPGTLVRVRRGTLPVGKRKRKRAKPDFESIVALPPFDGHPSGALLALGSGSRPNRRAGALLALYPDGTIKGVAHAVDLRLLYSALAGEFREVNVEGAFVDDNHLSLLQRGSKGDPRNARVRLTLAPVLAALAAGRPIPRGALSHIAEFRLGTIAGVPLCFTDGATGFRGGFAFTAVAEDIDDSYADGACAGSAIGIAGADDRLHALWRLEPVLKVEGIAARIIRKTIELTVVTDADDVTIAARLLRIRMPYAWTTRVWRFRSRQ
jgi:hypothetical protein